MLILIVFFVERPRLSQEMQVTFVAPRFESQSAQVVQIISPAGDFRYEKGEEAFPNDLLKALENLQVVQVISRNPGKQALFGVDEIHATHLVVKDSIGKIIFEAYLGTQSATGAQYLKKPLSSDVLEVTPSLKLLLPLPDLGLNL
jgi:hypothetical protein